jgi:hypothetical protein
MVLGVIGVPFHQLMLFAARLFEEDAVKWAKTAQSTVWLCLFCIK